MVARADDEFSRRQQYCIHIYKHYLCNDTTLLGTIMEALKARFYGAMPYALINYN